jgi:hypothetical protein
VVTSNSFPEGSINEVELRDGATEPQTEDGSQERENLEIEIFSTPLLIVARIGKRL